MVIADFVDIAEGSVILAAGTHGDKRARPDLLSHSEDPDQIIVQHLSKVLQVPAHRSNLRDRLPGHGLGAQGACPPPDAPKITVKIIPEVYPGLYDGIHGFHPKWASLKRIVPVAQPECKPHIFVRNNMKGFWTLVSLLR
jgi:hypothetical protein